MMMMMIARCLQSQLCTNQRLTVFDVGISGSDGQRETLLQRCLLPEIRQNSTVRRSFRISAGRRAVASSEVEFLCSVQCRTSLNRLYGPQQPGLEPGWLRCMGALQQSEYRIPISNVDDLKDSTHLLGECWPTDHRQVYWPVAWQTEGCGSSEWWTHLTVVLIIWFICLCQMCKKFLWLWTSIQCDSNVLRSRSTNF